MTLAGWTLLIAACGGITTWVAVCYVRILRAPHPEDEMHAPLDVDTSHGDRPVPRPEPQG